MEKYSKSFNHFRIPPPLFETASWPKYLRNVHNQQMLEAETLTLPSSSNILEFRKREEGEDKTTKIYGNTPLKNIPKKWGENTIRGESY